MCSLPIITVGSGKVDVYVKHASGQTTTFYLIPSDPVRKIYDRVAEVEKVSPSAIRIKYTGKVLNPELTVGYMGICAETILKAEVGFLFWVLNICLCMPNNLKRYQRQAILLRNISIASISY